MSPNDDIRPLTVEVFTALLGFCAILTCYAGLSAAGFLVPAACLLLEAALVWAGRAKRMLIGIVLANLVAGAGQDLVVALGDDLGRAKLDIAGVLLLIHLLCGGPLAALLGMPLLAAFRWSKTFSSWFGRRDEAELGAAE